MALIQPPSAMIDPVFSQWRGVIYETRSLGSGDMTEASLLPEYSRKCRRDSVTMYSRAVAPDGLAVTLD